MIRIGVIGTGNIAGIVAKTMARMDCVERYAAASRDLERARAFAETYGFEKAYGSYEEMLADPQVQLVYVATPHSHHYEHMKLCLEHGKHVLCEKSFTVNERQAAEIFAMSAEKGLLVAEAIWPRYIPMRKTLTEVLESGVIGTPRMMTANLCYLIEHVERIQRPDLAGGALLDVGVYALNFASMAFGNDVEKIISHVVKGPTGVDMQSSFTLVYRDGRLAVLNCAANCLSDRKGIIYGDKGFVIAENINNMEEIKVFDVKRRQVADYYPPANQISGYEYQIEACVEAIEKGQIECPQMPHRESLQIMRWMDELRRQWGLVYPGE